MKTRILLFVASACLSGSLSLGEDCCPQVLGAPVSITDSKGEMADGIRFTFTSSDETVVEVSQKGKAFSPGEISIKMGDKVSFVNDDAVSHNVYCRGKDFSFNIGAQEPGQTNAVQFTKPGKFLVRCAVHVSMKLVVNVQ